eukprot:4523754-Pleurochrysis_carterae.AAC.1
MWEPSACCDHARPDGKSRQSSRGRAGPCLWSSSACAWKTRHRPPANSAAHFAHSTFVRSSGPGAAGLNQGAHGVGGRAAGPQPAVASGRDRTPSRARLRPHQGPDVELGAIDAAKRVHVVPIKDAAVRLKATPMPLRRRQQGGQLGGGPALRIRRAVDHVGGAKAGHSTERAYVRPRQRHTSLRRRRRGVGVVVGGLEAPRAGPGNEGGARPGRIRRQGMAHRRGHRLARRPRGWGCSRDSTGAGTLGFGHSADLSARRRGRPAADKRRDGRVKAGGHGGAVRGLGAARLLQGLRGATTGARRLVLVARGVGGLHGDTGRGRAG